MKKTGKGKAPGKKPLAVYPPLPEGATIGLVAPAGSLISREKFAAGVEILEKKGFRLKFNRRLLNRRGYLAGTDRERADEFNRLWADPEVKALVAARGGYGSLRMIDLLNLKQIRRNPKIFIGFSDLTVLLNALYKKTKLICFHGPVITTLASIDRQSRAGFFRALTGELPAFIQPPEIKIVKAGRAEGLLLGGNLTTLVHMIGTPYEIPWKDVMLFIEDTGESPYRLDRLLTHLEKANRLQKIKGLILGSFTDDAGKKNQVMKKKVRQRVTEILAGAGMNIPVWTDFPVGHGRRNLTLPIGIRAVMDSAAGRLEFKPTDVDKPGDVR